MAFQPPPEWDQYIGAFGDPFAPVDLSPPVQQFALPGELSKGTVSPGTVPPPQTIAEPGTPTQEEVPAGAVASPLSPEEEAQIQIDAPGFIEAPQSGVLTPPLLGQVDAVSGDTAPEQQAATAMPTPSYGPGGLQLQTQTPDEYLSDAELGQKYSDTLTPEQQEAKRAEVEDARSKMVLARQSEEATNALRAANENARIYQESVQEAQKRAAQADEEAKQIAETNPLDTIGTGRKVLGVLASIVGGFMMNKTGRNVGLETVDKMIDQASGELAVKLHSAEQRGRNAREGVSEAGNVYHMQEAVRLALYDQSIKHIETEAQQFDPRGTQALRRMDTANELKQRRAKALADYLQSEQKRLEDQRKYELDALKTKGQYAKDMADVEKTQLESAKLAGQLGGGGAGVKPVKPGDELLTADQLRAQGINVPENVQLPPEGWTVKHAKSVAETAKSFEDWQKAARENSPEERARQFAVGEIVDEDNKPVLFRDQGVADKVALSKEATANAARLIDQLLVLRDRYGGWKSDLWKSPEWRRMRSDFADLQLEKKDQAGLGVLAGPDMNLINGTFGTSDPSEMRDPTPGLKRARMNMVEKFNEKVRSQAVSQKPKRYEPPDLTQVAAPDVTPDETDVKQILEFNEKRPTREEAPTPGILSNDPDFVPPHYRQTIDRLAAKFHDRNASPKEQQAAGALLVELQKNAHAERIRRYAQRAAMEAAMSAIPASPEEIQ